MSRLYQKRLYKKIKEGIDMLTRSQVKAKFARRKFKDPDIADILVMSKKEYVETLVSSGGMLRVLLRGWFNNYLIKVWYNY